MTSIESILKRLTKAVSGTDRDWYTLLELKTWAANHVNEWDESTPQNIIADTFTYEQEIKECRRCSKCGILFREGWMTDNGSNYYCSEDCISKDYTQEEFVEANNSDELFFTSWF